MELWPWQYWNRASREYRYSTNTASAIDRPIALAIQIVTIGFFLRLRLAFSCRRPFRLQDSSAYFV